MTTQPAAHPEATREQSSTTQPKKLSRKEMEARRLKAASMIGNLTKTALAGMCGVSRNTIYRWQKMRKQGKLTSTKATGRPRFLTPEQEQQLKIHCESGITYDGLAEQIAGFGVRFKGKDQLRRVRIRLGIPLIKMSPGRPRG